MGPDEIRDGAAADLNGVRRFLDGLGRPGSRARETAAQACKAALAAVAAWPVAVYAFGIAQPYLAAWVALVMVRPTVHWSLLTAFRQIAAFLLGVGIAVAATALPGKALALGAAVVAAVLAAQWPRLDDQGLYVPFTALIIIALDGVDGPFIVDRLLETGLGAAVGMAVNLLVMPPLRLDGAGSDLRRDGDAASGALRDLAARLREGDGPEDLSGLGERPGRTRPRIRRARDSLRLNPRSGRRRVEADRLESAFTMLRNAIDATRAIAGLLDPDHRPSPERLDPGFRDHYANALDRAADYLDDRLAAVLSSADPPAPPGPDIESLERLAARPDGAEGAELQGALLAALRRLLRAR
ncbi:FUSC family protein [Glycomyces artemisiae]|uniref:Uncharacterized membrane protein YgaE (UPF0421/DUF939 family) n=1 Tax=Glycomyces artemisiae TaxID=1076443 RepID=A0A2T0UHG6_9ACTN|nr:aromatic acid exporter family protein [Glycomyces artemisiae]PRY57308.1 uncharacterized membrane protein YgaE (UPF0421/DUF939 family) [Glycomyces artemisiae]